MEALGADSLEPVANLLQTLENDLAQYLNEMWAKLITDLGSRNLHDRFKDFLKLPDCGEWMTFAQPVAASGVFFK